MFLYEFIPRLVCREMHLTRLFTPVRWRRRRSGLLGTGKQTNRNQIGTRTDLQINTIFKYWCTIYALHSPTIFSVWFVFRTATKGTTTGMSKQNNLEFFRELHTYILYLISRYWNRFYLLFHESQHVFGFPFLGVLKGKLAISANRKGMNTVSVDILVGTMKKSFRHIPTRKDTMKSLF